MYVIDKNIPTPGKASKYPFSDMEIGDSFLAPAGTERTVRAAAHKYVGAKFVTRTVREGLRVWRSA